MTMRRVTWALLLGTVALVACGGGSVGGGTDVPGPGSDTVDVAGVADTGADSVGDVGPDAALDAPTEGAPDEAAVDPSAGDPASEIPGDEGEAGPRPPRMVPLATPGYASPLVDSPFLQEVNHTVNEVEPGIGPLVAVALAPAGLDGFDAVTQFTARGYVRHAPGAATTVVKIPDGRQDLVAAASGDGWMAWAGPDFVYAAGKTTGTFEVAAPAGATITGLAGAVDTAWALTTDGFGRLDPATAKVSWISTGRAATAATQRGSALFIGGQDDLAAFEVTPPPGGPALRYTLTAADGLVVAPVRALVADVTLPQTWPMLVIGDHGIQALAPPTGTGNIPSVVDVPLFAANRVPLDGPVAAARTSDGGFVVAAHGGAYRMMSRELGPEWRVYNADRWLPDGDVRGIATDLAVADAPLYFATAGGLATVTAAHVTLQQKVADIVDRIVKRHDRDGAVADSRLITPGDLSTNIPYDSDNDGGWTCYWLLAECFRWKATAAVDAKQHFDKSLDRMLSLRTLTGTDWFVARSVIRKAGCVLDDCDAPDDGLWFTSPDGQWWVKSDTSNDEVTSHMFMMGHAYDLCADDGQKALIRDHVRGIVGGLVDHGYDLLKPDGVMTTYGQFDPDYVNGIVGVLADGGRRSVQMLAALNLALYLTGDAKFADAKAYLVGQQHYDQNVVHECEAPARIGSGDGDELATQAFFVLLRYETDPDLFDLYQQGWANTYGNLRLQEAAWWDFTNGVLAGASPDFANALRWLREVPVDGIRWFQRNLQRHDLTLPPTYYVKTTERWARSDGHPLPGDERPNDRLNTSQYNPEGGNGPGFEVDGADVAAAYWMARYYGFLAPSP